LRTPNEKASTVAGWEKVMFWDVYLGVVAGGITLAVLNVLLALAMEKR